MALAIEPECERPDAGQLAFVEHEDQRVATALLYVAAARPIGRVQRAEPETVLTGAARPTADLLHQAVHVELVGECAAREGELSCDRAVTARRYEDCTITGEVDRVLRLHRPGAAADVVRHDLHVANRAVRIQVEAIDAM